MQLTDRINRIQISPTAAVLTEAEKLKSRGVDVADFGTGEPDFPTPDHIKKAGIRAIGKGRQDRKRSADHGAQVSAAALTRAMIVAEDVSEMAVIAERSAQADAEIIAMVRRLDSRK